MFVIILTNRHMRLFGIIPFINWDNFLSSIIPVNLQQQYYRWNQMIDQIEDVNWLGQSAVLQHDEFFDYMGHWSEWSQ